MNKGRKTTYEERLASVQYCLAHDNNYQETVELYQVSYQQVYSWVQKYNKGREKALLDRRGKAKEETKLFVIVKSNNNSLVFNTLRTALKANLGAQPLTDPQRPWLPNIPLTDLPNFFRLMA